MVVKVPPALKVGPKVLLRRPRVTAGPIAGRAGAIVLVLLLTLAGLLASAGGAGAQGSVDYTLPHGDPVLPDAENEVVVLDDPDDDATTDFLGLDAPPTAASGPADLVSVTLAETEEAFLLKLQNREYDETLWQASAASGGQWFCSVQFEINGYEGRQYGINLVRGGIRFPPDGQPSAYLYKVERDDDRFMSDVFDLDGPVFVTDHFEVAVPKEHFEVSGRGRPLAVGDTFTDMYAFCYASSGAFLVGGFYDEASADSAVQAPGKYEVRLASGSTSLSLSLDPAVFEMTTRRVLPVAAGEPVRHKVIVGNLLDQKTIVQLNVSVTPDAAAGAGGDWKVVAPPHLEIPARGQVEASVTVTAPAGAAEGDAALLQFQGTPVGTDEKARLRQTLVVATPLGPSTNTLYAHELPRPPCGSPCAEGLVSFDWAAAQLVLSARDDDPRFDDTVDERPMVDFSTGRMSIEVHEPFVRPVRFDPDGRIEVDLMAATDVPHDRRVTVMAVVGDYYEWIGSTEQLISLTTEPQKFTFALPVSEDVLQLPAGANIQFSVVSYASIPFCSCTMPTPSFVVQAQGTEVRLPLVEPQVTSFNITDGRAVPTVQLRNGTDAQEYINPGKTRAYELALVNEGTETDVLKVTLDEIVGSWSARVEPGTTFRLEPGQRAPFTVLVSASEDVKESEVLDFAVIATSQNDEQVQTSLRLQAIATGQIQLEDDEYVAPSDEEMVEPLVEDTEEAPLGLAVWTIVAAMALVASRRSRRTG